MAAPSGIVWGGIAGGYGRIGIYVKLTSTATQTTRHTEIWFWSKYSVSDTNNTFYYNDDATSATTSKGSVSISTTVESGSGWSTSNQVKLKEYDYTFTRGTSSLNRSVAAKLTNVDRVGATMSVSTSYTIPALASYTIKYNANGGSGAPSSQTKYYGKTLTLSSVKPTRTGHTFKGWATSSSGSVAYASGANYTSNVSVTLYAVWQANTYTIKYNANGGSGAPSSQTKTYGVSLTLSSTKPTRNSYIDENGDTISYTFKGWSTSSSSTAVAYKSGSTYTANASATLYAVWSTTKTINTYDIVYVTGDGTKVTSQVKTRNVAITLSSNIPKRNGFTFVKWNTNSNGSGTSYNPKDVYSTDEDLILYAIWTPWTHTVNFDINGGFGDIPSSFVKTGGINQIISEIAPIKSGYTLSSWNTKSDGSGLDYYPEEAYDGEQNGGTITLYAMWETTNIFIYPRGEWKSREFIEIEENESYNLSFVNDGTVHCIEFIEGNEMYLNSNALYVTELLERTITQLTDETDVYLTDELDNYLTTLI